MSNIDPLIDRVFDRRYVIKRKLGSGGMADVYLAEDQELGRNVALKLLNERHAADEQFVERFRREAQSAAGLNHPNIVSIFDRGYAEGTYYIAMEYLEGRTLKELLVRNGPTPIPVSIEYARQILGALAFAHRNGIVHRDIKPHNIVVGSDGRLKVTDFGIARSGASQMTEAGSIVGTAQYLSPEQARGASVDPRSDLYSLGIVLYEMLTGHVPFTGDTPVEIAMKHLSLAPEPPSALRPEVPHNLDAVVMRALAKDPDQRYGSAEEMDAELARVARGLAVSRETEEAMTQVIAGTGGETAHTMVQRPRAPDPGSARLSPARAVRVPGDREEALALAVAGRARRHRLRRRRRLLPLREGPGPAQQQQGDRGARRGARPASPGGGQDPRGRADDQRHVRDERDGAVRPGDQPGSARRQQGGARLDDRARRLEGLPDGRDPRCAEAERDRRRLRARPRPASSTGSTTSTRRTRRAVVIGESPKFGTTVKKGSTVRINVSKGLKPIALPDVTTELFPDAEATLKGLGFHVARTNVQDSSVKNTVISEDPPGGTQQPVGSTITLTVSSGPGTIQVPDVTTDTADVANSILSTNFVVATIMAPVTDPTQDGHVINQTPQGGTTAKAGSLVTITVGQFSQTTTDTTSTATTTTP